MPITDTHTQLDELIKAERAKANARFVKLRLAAAAKQRKVDEKVVELLRERQSDHYERLAGDARRALASERDERSKRARGAADSSVQVPETPAPQVQAHIGEEVSP